MTDGPEPRGMRNPDSVFLNRRQGGTVSVCTGPCRTSTGATFFAFFPFF